jgi:hypothetical protein
MDLTDDGPSGTPCCRVSCRSMRSMSIRGLTSAVRGYSRASSFRVGKAAASCLGSCDDTRYAATPRGFGAVTERILRVCVKSSFRNNAVQHQANGSSVQQCPAVSSSVQQCPAVFPMPGRISQRVDGLLRATLPNRSTGMPKGQSWAAAISAGTSCRTMTDHAPAQVPACREIVNRRSAGYSGAPAVTPALEDLAMTRCRAGRTQVVRCATEGFITRSKTALIAGFTSGEREYIRRELDQFFSTLPTVAEGFLLKT